MAVGTKSAIAEIELHLWKSLMKNVVESWGVFGWLHNCQVCIFSIFFVCTWNANIVQIVKSKIFAEPVAFSGTIEDQFRKYTKRISGRPCS